MEGGILDGREDLGRALQQAGLCTGEEKAPNFLQVRDREAPPPKDLGGA